MTESTPAVIKMLSAELSGAEAKDPDGKSKLVLQVVNTTCKPLVRDLAKNFDEEDERKKATATATALAANALQREQLLHLPPTSPPTSKTVPVPMKSPTNRA